MFKKIKKMFIKIKNAETGFFLVPLVSEDKDGNLKEGFKFGITFKI